jgi:hypothetical protein
VARKVVEVVAMATTGADKPTPNTARTTTKMAAARQQKKQFLGRGHGLALMVEVLLAHYV